MQSTDCKTKGMTENAWLSPGQTADELVVFTTDTTCGRISSFSVQQKYLTLDWLLFVSGFICEQTSDDDDDDNDKSKNNIKGYL